MNLSDDQRDALTELINIAFSRAAASLSDLTGDRVELQVPEVGIYPIVELPIALSRFVRGDVATVHQIFSGPVAGDAFMLLNFDAAIHLVELLTQEASARLRLNESDREVLAEVGNILLTACLGVFGNLLEMRLSFSVPRLQLEVLQAMLNSIAIGKEGLHHSILVGAHFRLRGSQVTGCLVLVLSIASLGLFMQAIERWAERAVSGATRPENEG